VRSNAGSVVVSGLTLPVGVLEALKMYASCISCLAEVVAEKCRCTWDSRCFDAVEGFRREDMAVRAARRDIVCIGFKL
jgi:hypothetical protein